LDLEAVEAQETESETGQVEMEVWEAESQILELEC
jgi:hypothetical protein